MARYRKKNGQWYKTTDDAENYSTEEQIIGTWIDGRPLYRKVIPNLSVQEVTSSGSWVTVTYLGTEVQPIHVEIFANNNIVIQKSYEITMLEGNLRIQAFHNARTISMCIVEYIKTTDVAVRLTNEQAAAMVLGENLIKESLNLNETSEM